MIQLLEYTDSFKVSFKIHGLSIRPSNEKPLARNLAAHTAGG